MSDAKYGFVAKLNASKKINLSVSSVLEMPFNFERKETHSVVNRSHLCLVGKLIAAELTGDPLKFTPIQSLNLWPSSPECLRVRSCGLGFESHLERI